VLGVCANDDVCIELLNAPIPVRKAVCENDESGTFGVVA
jgi:hypothetical protein